jgi:hypothetical protein
VLVRGAVTVSKVVLRSKTVIDVEMQREKVACLRERVLFYCAGMVREQVVSGDDYGGIKRVIGGTGAVLGRSASVLGSGSVAVVGRTSKLKILLLVPLSVNYIDYSATDTNRRYLWP